MSMCYPSCNACKWNFSPRLPCSQQAGKFLAAFLTCHQRVRKILAKLAELPASSRISRLDLGMASASRKILAEIFGQTGFIGPDRGRKNYRGRSPARGHKLQNTIPLFLNTGADSWLLKVQGPGPGPGRVYAVRYEYKSLVVISSFYNLSYVFMADIQLKYKVILATWDSSFISTSHS